MTEHLPECPVIALLIKGNTVAAGSCICARLRACEQRGGSERPTNTPGWFDSRDVWHDGHAVTHTESTTESGPNYCRECSEAQGHWVRWPCSPTSRGSSDG